MRKRQFLFRLFYSTSFSILLVIEILLLLISPGDFIYQSFAAGRRLSIIAVAIVYVAVLLISAFIIATRFYTAHTQLTAIPKSHVPIRKDDLSKSLRKLIDSELSRSASIAYHAHPRSTDEEEIQALVQEHSSSKTRMIGWPLDHMKSWLEIRHPGWSSPCAIDLTELQFEPVLLEFPHLLEAKAVSLVSPENVTTNSWAIELLQRCVSMSLRDYFGRLEELRMLDVTSLISEFIKDYERSRFSSIPISEKDFRRMLESFTAIIQGLRPPSDEALDNFVSDLNSSNKVYSHPDIRSRSSKPSPNKVSMSKKIIPKIVTNKKRSESGHNNNIPDLSIPLTRSLRSFPAAQARIYQASLSSGHAGDQSSDSSDSENDYSAHTGHTRSRMHSQAVSQARSVPAETEQERISKSIDFEPISNPHNDVDDDLGSVIRRTVTGRTDETDGSDGSRKSLSSVIWRQDQGESTLSLPMVNNLDDHVV
ncbi:MAG: hypothetical protein GOMPHAMPRED_006499 [Gomphillus americanus]|uniref:Defect at low temperature protein 1 n=1 Tax=Gomphillus americanus TaxID=1940652 RepID=A0A8H3FZN6_9LECA|nr:MAG: hypothetical protein GOMPHAMPRED_006499 [Gomphillus americanus]